MNIIQRDCKRSLQLIQLFIISFCSYFAIYTLMCLMIRFFDKSTMSMNSFKLVQQTPEFTPGFQWGSCYWIFSIMCMFCRLLFVPLSFFFWLLCCMSFFDLRILITSLVSSNSSYISSHFKYLKHEDQILKIILRPFFEFFQKRVAFS